MILHKGGCHCGKVRFEALAAAIINVAQCNCSVCQKSGLMGMTIPKDRFTLTSGAENLTEYRFDSGVAKHLFCKTCGIKSFYIPRSHPDGICINARCLDPGTVESMNITEFDGQNWEQNYPRGRADGYSN